MIKHIRTQAELDGKVHLPIFARESYLKCKGNEFGWFESDQFTIPYVIQGKLIFKWLTFMYQPIAKREGLTQESEKLFLQEVIDFIKTANLCDFINKAQAYVLFNAIPDTCDKVEYGTYRMNIEKADEEILADCHHKHRYKIRKATREGIEVKTTNDIDLVHANIKHTMVRQNSMFYPSYEYIKSLAENCKENVKFFITEKDGKIQGSAILIYDDNAGYYMFGGSIPKPATGAINLMHYEMIKFLRDRGIFTYDFVGARVNAIKGSKYDGIQRFKKGFGSDLVKGYTFRYVVNPAKYKLFRSLINMYGYLSGNKYNDVIDQIKEEEKLANKFNTELVNIS